MWLDLLPFVRITRTKFTRGYAAARTTVAGFLPSPERQLRDFPKCLYPRKSSCHGGITSERKEDPTYLSCNLPDYKQLCTCTHLRPLRDRAQPGERSLNARCSAKIAAVQLSIDLFLLYTIMPPKICRWLNEGNYKLHPISI